ncbi:hypothetical protein CRG98_015666, partial [Punica granatum]
RGGPEEGSAVGETDKVTGWSGLVGDWAGSEEAVEETGEEVGAGDEEEGADLVGAGAGSLVVQHRPRLVLRASHFHLPRPPSVSVSSPRAGSETGDEEERRIKRQRLCLAKIRSPWAWSGPDLHLRPVVGPVSKLATYCFDEAFAIRVVKYQALHLNITNSNLPGDVELATMRKYCEMVVADP